MKFTYKFEAIKKIKEIFEKKAQKELATVQLEIEKKQEEYDDVLKLRMQENKKYIKMSTASEIKFHKEYLSSLNGELESIRKQMDALLTQKEEKLQELVAKSKEHKIFDTLEEIHHEQYNAEQNKLELAGIDEIATQKYSRNMNER